MPLVIFTGINHHFKTCLFGSALLPNETDETYIWALKIVKEMSTCTNPPADVVESQSDEEDDDDDMDDDGDDDGDDGEDGDDDDGDDDQGGQPPKKQRTSKHNTTGEPIGKSHPQQKIGARTRSNTSQQEKGA
ncbi:unnamed protein product [Linum trigynum]|uniref:MULE transposase domain-containing protein n=1 Tax=Linum trigynum TaxID=586398 RepID=A0AAV2E707_9ROSI